MDDRINVDDNTLFIGDNLDILRGLNSESVDLVYLDPPRNSGRIIEAGKTAEAAGFTFDDKWTQDDMRTDWLDEIELRQPDAVPVITAAKVAHDDGMAAYLTFMGVRLLELRRILRPSGSIYLHCNPRTAHYLKALMDALFGYEQFQERCHLEARGHARRSQEVGMDARHAAVLRRSARVRLEPGAAGAPA